MEHAHAHTGVQAHIILSYMYLLFGQLVPLLKGFLSLVSPKSNGIANNISETPGGNENADKGKWVSLRESQPSSPGRGAE